MSDAPPLDSSVARLHSAGGTVVGAGFLVSGDAVLTCAHVVARALDADERAAEAPPGTVWVEFPLVGGQRVPAVVRRWWPAQEDGSGDVAVLRLSQQVPGTRPVRFAPAGDLWGHRFRVLGFPAYRDSGIWVAGELRGALGGSWVQINSDDGGPRVERGFSGAPVWDDSAGGVAGMAVAVDGATRPTTAYLVPAAALARFSPDDWPSPYRGLLPFTEGDAAVFHGRRSETGELAKAVAASSLVAVAGGSGAGKTSLVRAGLFPLLREQGTEVVEFRPIPGPRPAALLAAALVPVLEPGLSPAREAAESAALTAVLDSGEGDALTALGVRLDRTAGPGGRLFFLNQFEELVTADPGAARKLLRLLVSVADAAEGCRVVVTLRPGAMDKLLDRELAARLSRNTVLVAPLDRTGLVEAITGPARTVAGTEFEPGLVDRIVADAEGEPGRMPLLEFLLSRLWAERTGHLLTHEAYERNRGLSGALVGYIEGNLNSTVLTQEDHAALRRLLVQLARPDDRGGFSRRPARTADLDPGARALAYRLSRTPLMVLGHTADGNEIVDLAHEALIEIWPGLTEWLGEERDFRTWQEQLRAALEQWERGGRDDGGLLRGAALAKAMEWAAGKPLELSPSEKDFIDRGRALEQRGKRRWRLATAVIAVLALAAGALAVSLNATNAEQRHDLRVQAAQLLSQKADQQAGADPATALQLALAAWHNDPGGQAATQTMLNQELAAGMVEHVAPHVWPGHLTGWSATPDGRTVAALVDGTDGTAWLMVLSGLAAGKTDSWTIPDLPQTRFVALSPDGRTLAIAGDDGSVLVWDVPTRSGPFVLQQATNDPDADPLGSESFTFSADSSRLLQARYDFNSGTDAGAQLAVWDVARRTPVPAGSAIPAGWSALTVTFGPDDDSVIVSGTRPGDAGEDVMVRGLDGRTLHEFPADDRTTTYLAADGTRVAGCDWDRHVVLIDAATGMRRTGPTLADCPTAADGPIDSTGRFVLSRKGSADERYETLTLVDLRDGSRHQTRLPKEAAPGIPNIAVVDGAIGPVVLAALGDSVFVLRTEPIGPDDVESGVTSTFPEAGYLTPLSPDRRYWADLTNDKVELTDAQTKKTFGDAPPPEPTAGSDTAIPVFTADSRHLAVYNGQNVTVYSVPGLTVESRIRLPDPPDIPLTESRNILSGWAPVVLSPSGGQLIALFGGTLTWWDADTGQLRAPPLPLGRDHADANRLAVSERAVARPGHPGEILLAMDSGEIRRWDVVARKEIGVIRVGNLGDAHLALVTDPAGERVLAQTAGGDLTTWQIDTGRPTYGAGVPAPDTDAIIGFGPDDLLATIAKVSATYRIQLWNLHGHQLLGDVGLPPNAYSWHVQDNRLVGYLPSGTITLSLHPPDWFTGLCATAGRDFTDEERAALPAGADPSAPCG